MAVITPDFLFQGQKGLPGILKGREQCAALKPLLSFIKKDRNVLCKPRKDMPCQSQILKPFALWPLFEDCGLIFLFRRMERFQEKMRIFYYSLSAFAV